MSRKALYLSFLALIISSPVYCDQTQGGGSNNTSRIYQNGAEVILDGSLHVTGASRTDKYLEIVAKSSITVPSANHVKVYLSSTTHQLCAMFDNGTTGCISSNTVSGVTAGYGLTNTGTGGNPILTLNSATTSFIWNTSSLQTNTTFYVGSGTIVTANIQGITPTISPTLGTIASTDSLSSILSKMIKARIVQIVSSSSTSNSTTTSSTYVKAANSSVTITPTLASNNILVIVNGILVSDTQGTVTFATIGRGNTNIGAANGLCESFSNAGGQLNASCTMVYLDSPLLTSATTYNTLIKSDGTHTLEFGNTGTVSTMAIEIGQ